MIRVRHYMPLLAAIMLTGILLFQGVQLSNLLQEREWEYSDNLLHNLSGRAQASLGRRFEAQETDSVRQVMSELYLFKRQTQAYLIGPDGRVIAADRLGYDGDAISQLPIPVAAAQIRQARSTLQGNIVADRKNGSLTAYFPVSMAADGERPFSRTAVLVINLEVAQGMEEVEDFVRQSILNSLALVVILVGTITVGLHFALTRRVTRMLGVANAYLAGDLRARNLDLRRDEIGEIAAAFNRVADAVEEKQARLQQSQDALQQLNYTLEQRVKDRTQELAREIEERSRAEEELQTVLSLAPDGIIVITDDGRITKFNEAAERLFDRAEADVVGQNVNCLMPDPHRTAHDEYLNRYHSTGIANVIGREREVDACRRDGQTFPIALSVSEIRLNGNRHYIGVVRDISERKAAEAALAKARQSLVEAEKMAALGGLVAGVAHEINTPVGVGVTAVSHLALEVRGFQERYAEGQIKRSDLERMMATCSESVDIIETNLIRASQLIRSFKEIAVDQTGDDVREIGLGDYIGQVLTSLRPRLKQRPIRVDVDVIPPDLRVKLQPGGLSQIVTNLVMNTLTHGFGAEDAGSIELSATELGAGVELVYRDNGKGMTPDVVDRIFDPFFTTRRGQGGSGLGMHVVYNIVTQKYGGEIRCESAPGKGTRFIITLPACRVATEKETASI